MAYSVFDIANVLLRLAYNDGAEELMSNMKLQKMLYYEQGYHLAQFGEPLFDDDIEAWQYGPVVPAVYQKYADYGRNGIEPEDKSFEFASDLEMNLFFKVFETYGKFSAFGLMELTHKETPWLNAQRPLGHGQVIPKEKLQEFFTSKMR